MVKGCIKLGLFLLASAGLIACHKTEAEQYAELEKKELTSGKHIDSVFFGLSFGMPSKSFFTYCWEMSKKGIFTDGENNQFVLVHLRNGELKHDASMNFYPDFYQNKICRMRVQYQYDAWAPWNKNLFSDSLLTDVLQMYEKRFPGNPFIKISDKGKGTVYVKVDGNRRITAGILNDAVVKVLFTDLIVQKEIDKLNEGKK